jgi:hypothetical protein
MKKICYLFVLSLLFMSSYAVPARALNKQLTVVSEPEPEPFGITLKFKRNGQTVYWLWSVFPDTTIDELRALVSRWSNDPDVRMSYNGTVLQDGFTLADYGIGAHAIISCS